MFTLTNYLSGTSLCSLSENDKIPKFFRVTDRDLVHFPSNSFTSLKLDSGIYNSWHRLSKPLCVLISPNTNHSTQIFLYQSNISLFVQNIILYLSEREGLKKVWNFPYFPKPTHPTRLIWKKITWSKNHF